MQTREKPPALFIITGLSGAGKSTALKVFEDLRHFSIDGLPCGVMPQVAAIMLSEPMRIFQGMALGLDVRQETFLADFRSSLKRLRELGFTPKLVFLEAGNQALIQRYASTRRPHPLENGAPGLEPAIHRERKLLGPIRDMADLVINTTDFSIHDLRRHIQKHVLDQSALSVKILSFGFKHGLPPDADFVFDLRFLRNPFFIDELRPMSGLDKPVAEYVFETQVARDFKNRAAALLIPALGEMENEGRYRVTIALGCTGGRHRSVAMAQALGKVLRQAGYVVALEHRDLEREHR